MQIAILILQSILIIIFILFTFIIKKYLPSYFKKKGENLATKEDIAEITQKTEEVQKDFKEKFEMFSSDVKFRYDYNFRQYSELYCQLYEIVIQSEYVRHFLKEQGNTVDFEQAPFLEISPTKRVNMRLDGGNSNITTELEIKETDISKFNKETLTNLIIEKGQYASQELLKMAVSYRFVHNHYSGGKNKFDDVKALETADEEEIRLIRKLIECIVKDFNSLRKELRLSYDAEEIETGIPHC